MVKVRRISMIFLLVFLLQAAAVYGHRPVMVKNRSSKEHPVVVEKPEISWAYYGILDGEPHYYTISSSVPFNLYVNILVPDFQPDGELLQHHDMSFRVLAGDEILYTADGLSGDWRRYYEEYGRDHYYWGPEFDRDVEAGIYSVLVYNGTNRGKYALAIGKIEKFNFITIMGAMVKAIYLDTWFFRERGD
jgi:hypothetical protein